MLLKLYYDKTQKCNYTDVDDVVYIEETNQPGLYTIELSNKKTYTIDQSTLNDILEYFKREEERKVKLDKVLDKLLETLNDDVRNEGLKEMITVVIDTLGGK